MTIATTVRQRDAVSITDAARLLDVHYETVRRLVASGKLEAFRVGRVIRIRRSVLLRYLQTEQIRQS
jgi:excisionase family DNA binding protein